MRALHLEGIWLVRIPQNAPSSGCPPFVQARAFACGASSGERRGGSAGGSLVPGEGQQKGAVFQRFEAQLSAALLGLA
jgi:hypothetical protein